MRVRRRIGRRFLPDSGFIDRSIEVCGGGPYRSTNNIQYVDGISLGQGPDQRHTEVVKLYSIHVKMTVDLGKASSMTTFPPGSCPFRCYFILDRFPTGTMPAVKDIFDVPLIDDETDCDLNCFVLRESLSRFKVLRKCSGMLVNSSHYSSTVDRIAEEMMCGPWKGRSTIYQEYKKNAVNGSIGSVHKNALYVVCIAQTNNENVFVKAEMTMRIKYFR
jgi:hypothetical protein